eukprot:3792096-Alexandrium_andersonii.AAC.1
MAARTGLGPRCTSGALTPSLSSPLGTPGPPRPRQESQQPPNRAKRQNRPPTHQARWARFWATLLGPQPQAVFPRARRDQRARSLS